VWSSISDAALGWLQNKEILFYLQQNISLFFNAVYERNMAVLWQAEECFVSS
jgi:hypothetical protein